MTLSPETVTLLADALLVSRDEITDKTALGVTEQWDSLAHMRMILAVEAAIGRPLGPEAIVSITSALEIEALLT